MKQAARLGRICWNKEIIFKQAKGRLNKSKWPKKQLSRKLRLTDTKQTKQMNDSFPTANG